jgi:O-antigen/teichoic acid export membrane protein
VKLALGRTHRGVLSVGSGTVAGQAVAALSAPFLTRLYTPEQFGIYTYLLALTMILSSVAALRLEVAVPLPASHDDARGVIRTASLAILVISALTALGVLVVVALGLDDRSMPTLSWALLPVLVALTAFFTLFSQVALRERAYTVVGVRAFIQYGGAAAGQFLLSPLTQSAAGLLGGQAIGRLLGLLGLARTVRPYLAPTPVRVRAVLRRYSHFPLMLAPSALLNLLGTYIPVFVITHLFGNAAAGNLGVAQQVLLLPAGLVATAVGQVFVGELSSRLRSEEGGLTRVFLRATRALAIPGVLLFAGVIALAQPVFPILFGTRWDHAADFAQAMALSVSLGVIVSPLSYLLIAMERAKEVLALDILRIVLVGGAGLAAAPLHWNSTQSAWVMFSGQVIVYVVTWLASLVAVRRADARLLVN